MAVAMFNSGGQFLQWISKRRAVTLLVAGEAVSVKDSEEVWRSPSTEVVVPKGVMLLSRAYKYFQAEISFTKDKMYKRDGYACQYCGIKGVPLTKDHVLPKSRGGGDSWENCVTACQPCNGKKDNKTPEEAGMKLLKKPVRMRVADDSEIWEMILDESPIPSSLVTDDESIEEAS